jgi:solute carrier family 25 aspartate/glutamate transporter 12/13
MRSSPQFGFTLAGYEVLQTLLPLPGHEDHGAAPSIVGGGSTLSEVNAPLPYLRCRNALKLINDLDLGFGKVKTQGAEAVGSKSWLGALRS